MYIHRCYTYIPEIIEMHKGVRDKNADMLSHESYLIHLPLMPHICISELGHHWFR